MICERCKELEKELEAVRIILSSVYKEIEKLKVKKVTTKKAYVVNCDFPIIARDHIETID
jgi:hypothetical protein